MSLIDRAKSHFEALGIQSIEIEEWPDEDGNPSVIYWKPITLAEKKKLFSGSSNLNDVGILADVVILKALDKDGNKLFSNIKCAIHKLNSSSGISNTCIKVIFNLSATISIFLISGVVFSFFLTRKLTLLEP